MAKKRNENRPLKEDQIQQQIIAYLSFYGRKYNFIFFSPMNEGFQMIMNKFGVPKNSQYRITAWLRKMGFLPGVSDIVIMHSGQSYCMELKTPKGVQLDSQKLFEKNCKRTGVPYEIVRSLDECQNQMRLWGIVQ